MELPEQFKSGFYPSPQFGTQRRITFENKGFTSLICGEKKELWLLVNTSGLLQGLHPILSYVKILLQASKQDSRVDDFWMWFATRFSRGYIHCSVISATTNTVLHKLRSVSNKFLNMQNKLGRTKEDAFKAERDFTCVLN